ncbi:MAG: tRNA (adenosine(37)-N6)-threonylcarbamoyltransferase complex dimerization subunit type 1 TsaB, partial [candidate division Zixibacteria bacterium]|nr:tRNA (adenosine(37)-N6)-threonylcarbamoyltransferase complex dimerization subunit type 1 TsaB [candidate division Zixibacteria bacterium]
MTEQTLNNILAIDTSGSRLILALSYGGDRLVQSDNVVDRSHGQVLLKKIDELFSSAALSPGDLQALIVTLGPGSFTGLRIGLAAAKGMAVALGIPILGVSLFEIAAFKLPDLPEPVHVIIPSRAGEVYCGTVAGRQVDRSDFSVVTADELAGTVGDRRVYGMGVNPASVCPEANVESERPEVTFSGADMLYLGRSRLEAGERSDVDGLEPLY